MSWPFPLSSIYWLGLHALLIHPKDTWTKMTGWNIKNDIVNHLLLLPSSKGLVFFFFFFSLHRLWCLCTLWCHAHLAVMPTQTQLNGQGQEQIAFRIYKALLEASTMYSRHRGRSLLPKLRTPEPALGHMDGHRRWHSCSSNKVKGLVVKRA